MRKRIIVLVMSLWLLPLSVVWPWQGKEDDKSIAELELMNETTLAEEALSACDKGAIGMKPHKHWPWTSLRDGYRIKREATAYLQTIELVAGNTHRGAAPQWATDMRSALLGEDEQRCLSVEQQVVEGHLQGTGEKAKKQARQSQPAKPKQ